MVMSLYQYLQGRWFFVKLGSTKKSSMDKSKMHSVKYLGLCSRRNQVSQATNICLWMPLGDLDLSYIWGHHHLHLVGLWISVDQLITSQLATPCWRDPTRSKQLSTVAIFGFQFGLYHVVASLSFLRSIGLASLFAINFFVYLDKYWAPTISKVGLLWAPHNFLHHT